MSDARPVVVFSLAPIELVFHVAGPMRGRIPLDDGWLRTEIRTRCGEVTYAHEWREDPSGDWRKNEHRRSIDRGTFLRRDHAEKIGRPCARCER